MSNVFKIVDQDTVEIKLECRNKYAFWKSFGLFLSNNGVNINVKELKHIFNNTGKVIFKGQLGRDSAKMLGQIIAINKKIEADPLYLEKFFGDGEV